MEYPKQVQAVVDFLNEVKSKYDCKTEGFITYANGNDGTDFDWVMNERLCEFGYGTPDGVRWAFKCLVYKDGNADIYCYPNGEMQPVETVEKQIMTQRSATKLYHIMYKSTDSKDVWNANIDDIKWEV